MVNPKRSEKSLTQPKESVYVEPSEGATGVPTSTTGRNVLRRATLLTLSVVFTLAVLFGLAETLWLRLVTVAVAFLIAIFLEWIELLARRWWKARRNLKAKADIDEC